MKSNFKYWNKNKSVVNGHSYYVRIQQILYFNCKE